MKRPEPGKQRNDEVVWPLILVIFVWIALAALGHYSYQAVDPKPDSIADDQFSAARADKILAELVGDSVPHPAGSAQNVVVRNRVVSMLESYGYAVQVQSGNGTVAKKVRYRSPDRAEVDLHNIIAICKSNTGENSTPKKPILLLCHYDSVPTGPGASDDGVGTAAVLEIARMLSTEPAPSRDVVFLITDGEEFGLLGANLFASEHPLMSEIGIVINLEARGTTGPSCMFETGNHSRKLIPIFSNATDKKFASSLFVEIYKRMSRDTDFTVFKRAGKPGFNFAYIGDVKNYHTTADNYENVDRRSLQHHGDNALGLLRELLASDELDKLDAADPEANDEAVYFDLYGKWIVWWPNGWSIWLSATALVLFLIASPTVIRRAPTDNGRSKNVTIEIVKHLGILILTIVLVFAIGYLIHRAVRLDPRLANPWPAQPVLLSLGYWLASFAVVGAIVIAFSKRAEPQFYWVSFCVLWLTLSFVTSVYVTGASHLFIVPALITAGLGFAGSWFGHRGLVFMLIIAAVSVGVIWIPLERLFYDAVGFRMPIVMMGRLGFVLTVVPGLLSLASDRTRFHFTMLVSVASCAVFVAALVFA